VPSAAVALVPPGREGHVTGIWRPEGYTYLVCLHSQE
jgi:hypothetical protein